MARYLSSHTGTEIDNSTQKVLDADTVVTEGSTNLITSGAVYAANTEIELNKMTTDTEQTVTGSKTFTTNILLNNNTGVKGKNSTNTLQYNLINTTNSDNIVIGDTQTNLLMQATSSIAPNQTNTIDLGTTSVKWKNLYLSGNISDGTNNISVGNIASRDYVNQQVENVSAYYITRNSDGDAFRSVSELKNAGTYYSGGTIREHLTRNDYAIVLVDEVEGDIVQGYQSFTTTDEYINYYIIYQNTAVLVSNINKDSIGIIPGTTVAYTSLFSSRYIFDGTQWAFQYPLNKVAYTQEQWDALNSGITAGWMTNTTTAINNKQDALNSQTSYNNIGNATTTLSISTNNLGQVTNITANPIIQDLTTHNFIKLDSQDFEYIVNQNFAAVAPDSSFVVNDIDTTYNFIKLRFVITASGTTSIITAQDVVLNKNISHPASLSTTQFVYNTMFFIKYNNMLYELTLYYELARPTVCYIRCATVGSLL